MSEWMENKLREMTGKEVLVRGKGAFLIIVLVYRQERTPASVDLLHACCRIMANRGYMECPEAIRRLIDGLEGAQVTTWIDEVFERYIRTDDILTLIDDLIDKPELKGEQQ